MKPPFFADDNGDLLVFRTAKDLESYLEPENIDDPTMRIFDSDGQLLRLVQRPTDSSFAKTFGLPGRRIGLVRIDSDGVEPDTLREKVLRFLGWHVNGAEELLRSESLASLVELALPYATE
jgi:hypothetical protein